MDTLIFSVINRFGSIIFPALALLTQFSLHEKR